MGGDGCGGLGCHSLLTISRVFETVSHWNPGLAGPSGLPDQWAPGILLPLCLPSTGILSTTPRILHVGSGGVLLWPAFTD